MPALPLTAEQKEDAARLKKLFLSWKSSRKEAGEPSSQDFFSDMVGFGQSAVSQYLNGKIPLNPHAAAKFSKALGCQISDFSESVAALAIEIGEGVGAAIDQAPDPARMDITELSRQEVQLVLTFRELQETERQELAKFAHKLMHKPAPPPEKSPSQPVKLQKSTPLARKSREKVAH